MHVLAGALLVASAACIFLYLAISLRNALRPEHAKGDRLPQ